jgi:hypothetical protein
MRYAKKIIEAVLISTLIFLLFLMWVVIGLGVLVAYCLDELYE